MPWPGCRNWRSLPSTGSGPGGEYHATCSGSEFSFARGAGPGSGSRDDNNHLLVRHRQRQRQKRFLKITPQPRHRIEKGLQKSDHKGREHPVPNFQRIPSSCGGVGVNSHFSTPSHPLFQGKFGNHQQRTIKSITETARIATRVAPFELPRRDASNAPAPEPNRRRLTARTLHIVWRLRSTADSSKQPRLLRNRVRSTRLDETRPAVLPPARPVANSPRSNRVFARTPLY